MKLQDKVAIITGAGRGLGRAVALAFGKQGAKVVLSARSTEEVGHVAEELRSLKKDAIAVPTDISDEGQVNSLVQRTLETYGTVDILVNNAGARGPIGPIHTISLSDWEQVLRVNLTAAFLCSKAVLPIMMEKKKGKIITVATTLTPRPNLTPYMVAKAGLIQFTKQLSRELKDFNIQVNALSPGYFVTPLNRDFFETEAGKRMVNNWPPRRPGNIDELKGILIYLAASASSFTTGIEILVDGGQWL